MRDEGPGVSPPCQRPPLRRRSYWALLVSATVFFSLEPGLSLVLLALGLSGVAATWIGMLAALLAKDALQRWRT